MEDAERRLLESETERKELFHLLLDREKPASAPRTATVEEDSTGSAEQFTTPFDRIGLRFDRAGAGARQPQFKARMR